MDVTRFNLARDSMSEIEINYDEEDDVLCRSYHAGVEYV